MSRMISLENAKNNSNNSISKSKNSNSFISENSNNNKKESMSLSSNTEERKNHNKNKKQTAISKRTVNNIINDLNTEYLSKSLEESENNVSNYSAKNRRPYKKKRTTIRKLNSQNYNSRKNTGNKKDKKDSEDIYQVE